MAESAETCETVQSWTCSFYHNTSRRWLFGTLTLTPTAVCFQSNKTEGSIDCQIRVEFSSIKTIRKALSSYVFGAITLLVEDNQTLWLSSFANRSATFLILQHFYHAFLFSSSTDAQTDNGNLQVNSSQGRTKLGTELLQSVYDSQKTLETAAVSLVKQGEQLSSVACVVEDIHEDLSVAERIASGLSSWLGRWKMPRSQKAEELIYVKQNDIADVLDVEALWSQVLRDKFTSRKESVLRVGKDGVTILDMKQKILHHFKWPDVSRIRVISPWEILVTRFLIGEPDLSYSIICVSMPVVLNKLERFAHSKMEYMNPPENQCGQRTATTSGGNESYSPWPSTPDASGQDLGKFTPCGEGVAGDSGSQSQLQKDVVSDAEAAELSATLKNLKSLALDINIEQDSQLDLIDRVTQSVEDADIRQKELDKKMKKLLK